MYWGLGLIQKTVLQGELGVSPEKRNEERQHKQEIEVFPPDAFCFLYEA